METPQQQAPAPAPGSGSHGYGYGGQGYGRGYGDGGDEGFTIDFRRILGTLKKYFWVVLLFLVAGGIGAVSYLNVATPIYRSISLLKVAQRVMDAAPTLQGGAAGVEDLRALEMLGTIQRAFLSRSLMERVAEKLDLENSPTFFPEGTPAEERSVGSCVGILLGNTKADIVRGTRLLQISFDHHNEDVARQVTEALIREFMALDGEQRLDSAGVNISYLMNERDRLEEKLRGSEVKLAEYSRQLDSVSVDSQLNIIAEQLRELNSRLTIAKADRLKLESDFEQITTFRDDPEALLQLSSVAQLPEILSLRSQLNALDAEVSAQTQRYGDRNPAIIQLRSQRDQLLESLHAEALRAPRTLEITLRAAMQNEKSLERETKAQEMKTIDVKDLAVQSSVLERQIEADRMAYEAVLRGLNDEVSSARSQPIFLQIVDPASPAFKIAPSTTKVVALSTVASLVLAGLTIFLLTVLDTSIKSVDEAERLLPVPVLSSIPEMPDVRGRRSKKGEEVPLPSPEGSLRLPLLEDQHSTVSEAFRTLRAALLMFVGEHQRILFTSAVPGEGKSFCSINISVAYAQRDSRVLLVDADLRKPMVEERLFGERNQALGLANYLTGEASFDDILRPTVVDNLFVVTAGRNYGNPAELLSRRGRLDAFFEQADAQFNRVITDAAPVLAVSDTLSLAPHFNTIALVIKSHRTGRRLVQRAFDLLARTGHPANGITLNMVPTRGSSYDYYYHSDSSRAYGHEDSDKPVEAEKSAASAT